MPIHLCINKVWLRMQHDLYTNLLPDLSILSAGIISLLPISCECTTSVSRPLWLDSSVGETSPMSTPGHAYGQIPGTGG